MLRIFKEHTRFSQSVLTLVLVVVVVLVEVALTGATGEVSEIRSSSAWEDCLVVGYCSDCRSSSEAILLLKTFCKNENKARLLFCFYHCDSLIVGVHAVTIVSSIFPLPNFSAIWYIFNGRYPQWRFLTISWCHKTKWLR